MRLSSGRGYGGGGGRGDGPLSKSLLTLLVDSIGDFGGKEEIRQLLLLNPSRELYFILENDSVGGEGGIGETGVVIIRSKKRNRRRRVMKGGWREVCRLQTNDFTGYHARSSRTYNAFIQRG